MKYSALSVIAIAATAIAAPSKLEADHSLGGPPTRECNANQKQVCCTPILGIPLLSSCLIQVRGSTCKNEAFCCQANQVNGPVGALTNLNVNALNCNQLL
ncbi:hypothetical protein FSARC_14453 [Fusarium sarcochroum]|uniref:Hydrophobin n=1 Tax=Fusarium sarcochroum TaxID=1208366 RepID=A0A8H4ST41_9HYPO|nr:hypothetical protein FSARC_14453 [Fusarium sarcochroum]